MAANLGYCFYREYYQDYFISKPYEKRNDESEKDFEVRQKEYFQGKNNRLFNASKEIVKSEFEELNFNTELRLFTTYPGLLVGSGYSFGTGVKEGNELKLGFYFDHTTGMPLIPGSSVKGLLRSAFPNFTKLEVECNFNEDARDQNGNPIFVDTQKRSLYTDLKLKKVKSLFTWWIVKQEVKKEELKSNELKWLYDLEQAIFESIDIDGKPLPVYKRDIFFDSYIISSQHSDKRVLGTDFISPHINRQHPELSPFTNPIPVMFLKILPKVEFRFCFDLKDHGISSQEKKFLFKRIIEIIGAGAKSNVGYGHFADGTNPILGSSRKTGIPENYTKKPKTGEPLQALVVSQAQKKVVIILAGVETEMLVNRCPDPEGVLIKVTFGSITGTGIIQGVNYFGRL